MQKNTACWETARLLIQGALPYLSIVLWNGVLEYREMDCGDNTLKQFQQRKLSKQAPKSMCLLVPYEHAS